MFTVIYFSPTGNVSYLATMLTEHLDEYGVKAHPLESVDIHQLSCDKHLVLLYAIHGFNAPRTVKRFVKDLPPNLYKAVSVISVGCTTHWVNHAASSDLRKLFEAKGYPVYVDEVLAMPLTLVTAFSDEVARKQIAESKEKIKGISRSLVVGKKTLVQVKCKSRLLSLVGKVESFASRLFGLELYARTTCNACGRCWKNCPEKNIKRGDNGKPQFGFNCLMCMRCIYNCPQQAIQPRFSKFIPIKTGYSLSTYLKEWFVND